MTIDKDIEIDKSSSEDKNFATRRDVVLSDKGEIDVICMACEDTKCTFKPIRATRRALGPNDVLIDMKYCGVCHSDLHEAAGHTTASWMVPNKQMPFVPGHELAGVVAAIGEKVTKFKVGDHIGVGCMVDSCLECTSCEKGLENQCKKIFVSTYGAPNRHGRAYQPFIEGLDDPKVIAAAEKTVAKSNKKLGAGIDGVELKKASRETLGGYTSRFVVDERFGIHASKEYPLAALGPLLCAGITAYTPLKKYLVEGCGEGGKLDIANVDKTKPLSGKRVGVVGLGGLGVMGVKLSKALGAHVTVVSRGSKKKSLALGPTIGADAFVDSTKLGVSHGDPDYADAIEAKQSLDLVLNFVPAQHDYTLYNQLLKPTDDGASKQVFLGLHSAWIACTGGVGKHSAKSYCQSSLIGGTVDTQEVVDLCAKYNIQPEIELKDVTELNAIYEALDNSNVECKRYVLDLEKSFNKAFGDEDKLKKLTKECESMPAPVLKPDDAGMNVPSILKDYYYMKWFMKQPTPLGKQ